MRFTTLDRDLYWRRWFAWRPVVVEESNVEPARKWVWLEWIERRGTFSNMTNRYRLPVKRALAGEERT